MNFVVVLALVSLQIFLAKSYTFLLEKCESDKTLVIFEKCEVKNNIMSVKMKSLQLVTKVEVSMILYKVENSKSRQLFKSPKMDFCAAIGNGRGSNPITKVAFGAMKNILAKLKCPWREIEMQNFTLERKLVEMFPSGLYRAVSEMNLSTDKGDSDKLMLIMVFGIE